MGRPVSTYRLQLHAGFTFEGAAGAAPLLARLGVTHLYLSPILQAAPGSTHGYDTIDPTRVDAERGGREGFDRLLRVCRELNLGLVLDIVPNHVSIAGAENPWWRSVLRLGRSSRHAKVFDIDWDDPPGRVILPVLGKPLSDELGAGTLGLKLRSEGGCAELCLAHYERAWPLRPRSAGAILSGADLPADLNRIGRRFLDLEREEVEGSGEGRAVEQALDDLDTALAGALKQDPGALGAELEHWSEPGRLAGLIEDQHYLPMEWRAGAARLNYRRFFDISSLIGVRVEDPAVFDATHALVLELVELEGVDGLRIDHPDGLRDPGGYFRHLAARADGRWIVAEKILEGDEALPPDWMVAGGTGYDFLRDALGVTVARDAEEAFTRHYDDLVGRSESFAAISLASKRQVAARVLRAELDRLSRLVAELLARGPAGGEAEDVSEMRSAIAELAAAMPVYRTYFTERDESMSGGDRIVLDQAVERARGSRPDLAARIDAIAALLAQPRTDARELAVRFQQYTAPVMAKGLEDTAFYRYNRFVALNEVGCDPGRFGLGVEAFHERVRLRRDAWPHAMLTTSTHDTKRSEDVRARLSVLSEMPDEWSSQASRWLRDLHVAVPEVSVNDLYLLLQTLVGAWPVGQERIARYMTKAAREAKEDTSWRAIDEDYERSLKSCIDLFYKDTELRSSVAAFVDRIRRAGRVKSLTQTALRLACPGVPDTYQGCELWDLSLVDPDNRRPVDFRRLRELLDHLDGVEPLAVWRSIDDPQDPGLAKLWVTRTLLRLRRAHPEVFGGAGEYVPIRMAGPEQAIAFARGVSARRPAFVVVLPLRTAGGTAGGISSVSLDLPAPDSASWTNLCTGREIGESRIDLGELFRDAPIALLADREALP